MGKTDKKDAKEFSDPGPIKTLTDREALLLKAWNDAQALPGNQGDALKRKQAIVTRIERSLELVRYEIALREQFLQATKESKDDPEPMALRFSKRDAWKEREKVRSETRKDAIKKLKEARTEFKDEVYSNAKVSNPCISCHKKDIDNEHKIVNPIESIEFLNGADLSDPTGRADPILSALAWQFVNLFDYRKRFDRDKAVMPAWLNSINNQSVESFDRLSRKLRVRIKFKNPGARDYWVQLNLAGGDAGYTATEKVASDTYKMFPHDNANAPTWAKGTTDADGIAIIELHCRSGGGEQWKAYAYDEYSTVVQSSASVVTTRGFFMATITMDKVAAVTTGDAVAEMASQFIHIEAKELEYAADKMPYQRFVYADDRFNAQVNTLKASARSVYTTGKLNGTPVADMLPYLVVCVFYDMSPNHAEKVHNEVVTAPAPAITIPLSYYLWDPDDTTVDWFVSCEIESTFFGATILWDAAKSDFTINKNSNDVPISLTYTPQPGLLVQDELKIRVKTKIISGGVNGFSSGEQGQGALVAICRRHSYKNRVLAEMNQTIVHELGHKVNFTAGPEPVGATGLETGQANAGGANAAVFRWLDSSPFHYIYRKHMGGHCYFDAIPDAGGPAATGLVPDFSIYKGKCVMFGAGNDRRAINYCAECSSRLKKLNIERGWTAP